MDLGGFGSRQTSSICINRDDLSRLCVGTLPCLPIDDYQRLQASLDEGTSAVSCARQIVGNYQYLCHKFLPYAASTLAIFAKLSKDKYSATATHLHPFRSRIKGIFEY